MHRLIQQKVKEPLAEEILFGQLEKGGRAVIKVKDDNIVVDCGPNVGNVGKVGKRPPKSKK